MLNIYVNGLSGKMGSSILNQVSKIEDILIIESIANCDVVIDFSRPESSLKILNQCLENKIPITSLSYFDTYLKDKKIMPLYKHRIVKENTLISFEYCEKYNRKYKKKNKQLSTINGKNVKDFVEKALQMKIGTFFIEHYKDRAFNLVHHFNCDCCEKIYKIAEY